MFYSSENQKIPSLENNIVYLSGVLNSEWSFSYSTLQGSFYTANLAVKRLSGKVDHLTLTISDHLLNMNLSYKGKAIAVSGQIRSHNLNEGTKRKVTLTIFIKELTLLQNLSSQTNENRIRLNGFLCRHPLYRQTPKGRDLTELLLAIHRKDGRSDYIPCICWGRCAHTAAHLETGDHLLLWGRIQSRDYQKRFPNGSLQAFTTYEVSTCRIDTKDFTKQLEQSI